MLNETRLERHPRTKAFVDTILRSSAPHPFNHFYGNLQYIPDYECVIEMTDDFNDGVITLGYIQSLRKGYGNGTACVQWFLSVAKVHGMTVHICAERQGNDGLTQSQLKAWYRSLGFKFPYNGREGSVCYA